MYNPGHLSCLIRHLVQALRNASMAGLWTRGSGCVAALAADKLFFLPQKPFMPLGTLRQQLLFPTGAHAARKLDLGESGHRCTKVLPWWLRALIPLAKGTAAGTQKWQSIC